MEVHTKKDLLARLSAALWADGDTVIQAGPATFTVYGFARTLPDMRDESMHMRIRKKALSNVRKLKARELFP